MTILLVKYSETDRRVFDEDGDVTHFSLRVGSMKHFNNQDLFEGTDSFTGDFQGTAKEFLEKPGMSWLSGMFGGEGQVNFNASTVKRDYSESSLDASVCLSMRNSEEDMVMNRRGKQNMGNRLQFCYLYP